MLGDESTGSEGQERMLAALEAARKLRETMPEIEIDVVEDIQRMRQERDEHLTGDLKPPARGIAPVVTKLRLGDKKNDVTYWLSRSPQERIDALKEIREEYHRWRGDGQSRIQRVCTIVKRK